MQLISALGSTKTPEATPALIELVETRKGKTRIAAISALGDLGGEAATRALARAIGSGVEDSRVAVRALAQIGDEGSRKVLLDLASSGDREASLEALRGLSDAEGDDVRQVMTAALGSADPDRASSAAAYFGEHGDAAAIPALTAMTRTGGTAAAQYALSAIAAIGGDPARLALADLARHGGGMQAHALAQLGALPGGHAEARGIALDVLHNGGAGISA